ncbi:hypothetical protein [Chlorogloea sp. CCALA 695]|nr:hypothetical protein [Chlorogloea sp. CCALA 695]
MVKSWIVIALVTFLVAKAAYYSNPVILNGYSIAPPEMVDI